MNVRKQKGFTLIELLGVLTVMAVLMAISIPAFKGIGKTTKVEGAVRNIKSTFSLARQHAILNRTNVYVAFPTIDQSEEYGQRGYSVYVSSNRISDWNLLPDGLYFDDNSSYGDNVFDPAFVTNLVLDGLSGDLASSYACVIFKSNGQVGGKSSTTTKRSVYVVEGIKSGQDIKILKTNTTSVKVFPYTGFSVVYKDGERAK